MPITVKKAALWRKEVENRPGMLAESLKPLAEAGSDLNVVMAYRYPGTEDKAAVEVHPISGRKSTAAARAAGFPPSSIPVLVVQGDNKPGLGHAIATAIGEAGINMTFLMAQVLGRRYAAIFGFENEADANKAVNLIKKAVAPRSRR